MSHTTPVVDQPCVESHASEIHFPELENYLNTPRPRLTDWLEPLFFGNKIHSIYPHLSALPVFRTHLSSGYNFSIQNKMVAYLRFGVSTSGYFIIQTLNLHLTETWVSHFYQPDGSYAFTENNTSHPLAFYPETSMEVNCPIINHIYNILCSEYQNTGKGTLSTVALHTLEKILQWVKKRNPNQLSLSKRFQDPAITTLNQEMMKADLDPVYTWKERHQLIKNLKLTRSKVIATKERAHHLNLISYSLPLFFYDFWSACIRFFKRPLNNSLGTLERILIDPIRWFGTVVKSNMGYSIALAIYSPFTFFFITQPMNPHATWAVGKVRSAYIDATEHLKSITTPTTFIQSASTLPGAANAGEKNAVPTAMSNNSQFGIPLSTDHGDVNQQSWEERMSNFKAMQITYESNMEAAPRIGRLEQMETQLNWPLIMESTWIETERYLEFLNFIDANHKDYTTNYIQLVRTEISRTEQVQLYLWDRNVRFILDHPFTMMDQGKEQTQADYYVGRAFILLRNMTTTLAKKHQGLVMPNGYNGITTLAQKFEADYHAGGSVLERLKHNSKLFAQADSKDTLELRAYMKRQWEILYLLQNHAQEGANTALQMYVWSVRNAAWILQSLISAKREEMSLLSFSFKKNALPTKISENPTFKRVDSQYEALFHMMVLEYTSIRKEIGGALKNDIEAIQRKKMIDNVENFLKERDTLLKEGNLI